jgi:hypothetical protein
MSYEETLERVIARLDDEEKEKDKRIVELESMLISRTKEVDDWILRYDKSGTKQRDIIHGQKMRIAELENPWISVDDEMPSAEHAIVIVDFYGGNVGVGYPHKGKILDEPMGMLFNGVTHWMPLPSPPKEQ